MNTREQFGSYLLLKKLSEDALGETFRAGRLGTQGMEEVVLLRVFDGPAIDRAALWKSISDRRPVQKALSSPNIGSGVDLGEVRGIPYLAYDYVSGKNLSSLIDQAAKRRNPVPADHALLIAERIALALAVGYETRLGEDRVLHGCLVPQLVMISNEGETRLLGFEAAPGLRPAVARQAELARYLSPEARSGKPAHKADDVWSLGIVLLELVTGKPAPADAELAAAIERAEMMPEATPLPDELRRLLAASLTSQDKRIGDVVNWHKALSKLMFDGQHNPTTFNLAFFMHNLFRDEIEKESQEIEVERTMEIPVMAAPPKAAAAAPAAAAGAAPRPAHDVREVTGVREDTGVIRDRYGIEKTAGGGKKGIVIGAIAAVLLAAAGIGWFLFGRGGSAEGGQQQAAAQPIAAPQPASLPPAGPSESELEAQRLRDAEAAAAAAAAEQQRLEAQIQALVEQRSRELEERLTGQYDQQIESLKSELDTARQKAAEAQEAAVEPPPPPAASSQPAPATGQAAPAAAAAQPTAAPAQPTPSTAQPAAGPQAAQTPPAATSTAAQQPAASPTPPTAPKAAAVQRGDLVTMGQGVVPPRLLSQPSASYPPMALRLRKEATVVVRVLVDENGRVAKSELKGKEAGFGMDREAMDVAKGARFQPATKDGVPVKMWWEMPVVFKL